MYYPVVFVWDGECYQMYAEDVIGATAISEGNDIDDAVKVMEEILSITLEANHPDGYPEPSTVQAVQETLVDEGAFVMPVRGVYTRGKNVRVTLSMPDYVADALDAAARHAEVSRSAYVANLVLGK